MSYPMTIYQRPHGHKVQAELRNINPEDEAYFREHDIIIGMEEIATDQIVVYAQYGETDGDPDEIIYIVPAKEKCEVSMANIRAKLEKALSEVQ